MTEHKTPVDRMLDLFVYAPLGLVMNLDEVLPQLIEKGHQQVTMARMFGQFAVETGTKEARRRLEDLAERGTRRPAGPAGPAPAPRPAPVASAAAGGDGSAAPTPPAEDVPAASELPITDYDSLSASQVVPRLDGLSPEERDLVRRYEAAHRGRKTILSKLAQLSG